MYLLVSLSCVVSAATLVTVALSLIAAIIDSKGVEPVDFDRSRFDDPHWWLIMAMIIPVINILMMITGLSLRLIGPFNDIPPFDPRK